MKKNEIIELNITDMSNEGSGVGHLDGMAVFVPLTAVGDTVRVKIVKVKKTCAYGIVEEILSPSPDRVENTCPVFRQCGGCVYRHISYESECRIKQNKVHQAIKRIGGIDIAPQPIIPAVSDTRYRNKAQFPVAQDGSVGFYAARSHRAVPCEDCLLQPEEFTVAAKIFGDFLREFKIPVYNETTHSGVVRHFYLRRAAGTGQLMAVVVINAKTLYGADVLAQRLKAQLGDDLKSVQLNINTADTNVILGKENITVFGGEYITDVLCGVKVRISPLSFYQVNRDMAEILYKKAAQYAQPQGKTVLDLYCGAGTIGLSLANDAKEIIGVEIVPQAIEDARVNARENGIENARFICADATVAAEKLAKENLHPDVVIVDPPRKGCEKQVLYIVARDFAPQRVVYVSCDPATLARDAAILSELGYSLIEYTPVDLFPRTHHVETVAYFVKEEV